MSLKNIGGKVVVNTQSVTGACHFKGKGVAIYGKNGLLAFFEESDNECAVEELTSLRDEVLSLKSKMAYIELDSGAFFRTDLIGSGTTTKSAVVLNDLKGETLYWLELGSEEKAEFIRGELCQALATAGQPNAHTINWEGVMED